MESSGKYWIPVFNVLEKTCFVTLAHPKYTKPQIVDGRCKTPIEEIQAAVDSTISYEQAIKLK